MMETVHVLCIGDPHFKVKNQKETDKMEESLLHLLEERTPDFIVVLGDVLHRHETIKESPLSRATKLLKMLEEHAPVYIPIGNHDRPNNSVFLTDQHPFNAMKYWDNTVVADVPLQMTIKGHRFTLVPYVFPGRFEEALRYTSVEGWQKSTCIFAHQEFRGAKMGAIISEDGDVWGLDLPLVISGHIHNYDRLQSNIIYVGTPIQHAFGDRADKTVSWFTFEPNGEFTEERIDLGVPKKVSITCPYDKIEDVVLPENAEIKVIVVGNTSQIKTAEKRTIIKEWIKKGVKVAYRDISTIDLEKREPEIVLRYEELMVQTLEALEEKERDPLMKLFKTICAEITE